VLNLTKLFQLFGEYKVVPSHKDEVRFCCPFCVQRGKTPDRKFHLYVSLSKGVGFCFRCNKVLKFTKDYMIPVSFYVNDVSNFVSNLRRNFLSDIPKCVPVYGSVAYQFLLQKLNGVYTEDYINKFIEMFEVKFCIDERFPHLCYRLMVPIKIEGNLVGFQFRSIFGEEPKYYTYNYKHYLVKDYVFNYDNAKNFDRVFLCEGIFDVMPFLFDGIAVFGKSLTPNQKRLIISTWKEVVICLDGDAKEDAYNLAYDLVRAGLMSVGVMEIPSDKDPCEIGLAILDFPIKQVDLGSYLLC